jgi:hypothetical protein
MSFSCSGIKVNFTNNDLKAGFGMAAVIETIGSTFFPKVFRNPGLMVRNVAHNYSTSGLKNEPTRP